MSQLHTGRVVSSTGNHCVVADEAGTLQRCQLRHRQGARPVCGDRVDWHADDGTAYIEQIHPRRNVIERGDFRGRPRALAANIDRLILVVAPAPTPDLLLVDRYRVLAGAADIPLMIWINKTDRVEGAGSEPLQRLTDQQTELGLPMLRGSAETGAGIEALKTWIHAETVILVGQSGVGKTSLTQHLIPALALRTGEISEASGQGRHTTTDTRLFPRPEGGCLIDSPGVRTLRLDHLSVRDVAAGFPDITEKAHACRFRDCHHLEEPQCAVQSAIKQGQIDPQRLMNWRRLITETGGTDSNQAQP
ncbi:MAG: ribosome small subunit-dependent GTPase A [Spiribacter sp.]|nr:ribosome small subunit-dependent GTPase A [Spiribacter sp.]